jgi:hypothetical protein
MELAAMLMFASIIKTGIVGMGAAVNSSTPTRAVASVSAAVHPQQIVAARKKETSWMTVTVL